MITGLAPSVRTHTLGWAVDDGRVRVLVVLVEVGTTETVVAGSVEPCATGLHTVVAASKARVKIWDSMFATFWSNLIGLFLKESLRCKIRRSGRLDVLYLPVHS